MLNHIVLMGRLTRDPELRRTGSGLAVASFSLAVDRDFGNRETGERETDFVDIVAWRNTAEFVSKYFTKGRMAVVSGRLQIRSWTDKDGNMRRTAEVVAKNVYFGDSKRDGDAGDSYGGFVPPPTSAQTGYPAPPSTPSGLRAEPGEQRQFSTTPPLIPLDDDDGHLPF